MTTKPFETPEEALIWAVEYSKRRDHAKTLGPLMLRQDRPCEIVDVFNVFQTAYREQLITKEQYTLFLYARKYGDLPPSPQLYRPWRKMMKIVEPIMADKGIIYNEE